MTIFFRQPWRHGLTMALLCGAHAALADELQQSVSLPVNVEYNSNFRMLANDKQSITRTIFTPTYGLTTADGADEFNVQLGMHFEKSSDQNVSENRHDPNASFDWSHSLTTGTLGLNARYVKESAQQTLLQENGLVASDGTRTTQSLGGRWATALSERSTLTTSLNYQDVSYSSVNNLYGGALTDYNNYSASLNWGYDWSETIAPFLLATANRYDPKHPTLTAIAGNNYSLQGGAKASLDNWEWMGQAGVNRVVMNGSENSWVGNTSLDYTGLRHNFELSAARSVNSNGVGGFIRSKQYKGTWGYAYDELTRFELHASWQKSDDYLQPNTYKQLGASASRDLSSFWTARFYYQHQQRQASGQSDATGDTVGITLTYSHPDF
jgi:hypothetical protein